MWRRGEVRWVRRPCVRWAAWGNEGEQARGRYRENWTRGRQGDEVNDIALDLGGHNRKQLDFAVITIVFAVMLSEQEAVVSIVGRRMVTPGLHTCAGVQMQTHQPGEDQ